MFEEVLYWNKPNHSIVNRFRFWDKKANRWFYCGLNTYPTYEKQIWKALEDGEIFYPCLNMQDKTGRDVYEGDIIKNEYNEICIIRVQRDLKDFGRVVAQKVELIDDIYNRDNVYIPGIIPNSEKIGDFKTTPQLLEGESK